MQDEPLSEPAPRRPDSALRLSGRRALEATAESVSGDEAPPERLGPYDVSKRLGRGAFGEVYLAYDSDLQRPVALKLLRDSAAPDSTERLKKEAQAMAALDHPALLTVYGLGEFNGRVYIAMEYAERGTMRDWLRERPRSTEEIVRQIATVARGLHAAHEAGFVHRDVKPSNILIGNDGLARLSDFGLVYADATAPTMSTQGSASLQTAMGGTPPYMAPELFDPSVPTPRSDEFALCVTLYEALFDRRPHWRRLVIEGAQVPNRRERPDVIVPAWLREVLVRGLESEPRDRFTTLAELADALEHGLGREGRVRRVLLGATVVSVAVGLGWAARPSDARTCEDSTTELAGIWDEARAAEVRSALAGTGLSFAESTSEQLTRTLDRYAESWTAAHREACEATVVRQQRSASLMDKAMACLAGRRRHLAAFVDVVQSAAPSAVSSAALTATQLPDVAPCLDAERLLRDVEPPSADQAAAVAELQDAVAKADALRKAGSIAAAHALLDEIEEATKSTDYAPLQQDYGMARAVLASDLAEAAREESELLGVFGSASRTGRRELASRAAQRLAVALAWNDDHDGAARWIGLASASSDPGDGAMLRAKLDGSRGIVWGLRGAFDEAVEAYTAALATISESFGPEDVRLVPWLRNRGSALHDRGDHDRARDDYDRAVQLATQILGAGHPATASVLINQASLECELGEHELCERLARQALTIEKDVLGDEHPTVAACMFLVARATADRGRFAEARTLFERADAIFAASESAASNTERLSVLNGLSDVNLTLGDIEASARYVEQAVEIARAADSGGQSALPLALSNLARVRSVQGRHQESLARVDEADELLVQRIGPDNPARVDVLGVRTATLMYLERYAEAVATANKQLSLIESRLGADHPSRAMPLYNVALSHESLDEFSEAQRHYEASMVAIEADGSAEDPRLVYPLVGIGRTRIATDRPLEAVAPLERALSLAEGQAQLAADAQMALARALVLGGGDRKRAAALADEAAATFEHLGGPATDALTELRAFRQEHGV